MVVEEEEEDANEDINGGIANMDSRKQYGIHVGTLGKTFLVAFRIASYFNLDYLYKSQSFIFFHCNSLHRPK